MYIYAHPQTRCSMNIFNLNLFICSQIVEAAAIVLPVHWGAYHSFHVYDHTLHVLCGKYIAENAVCGDILKRYVPVWLHVFFPFAQTCRYELIWLCQSHNSSEVLFWKYTIYAVYFSVWYERPGVVQAQAFFLGMHPTDDSGLRVSSPSPAGRCDAGHHGH